VNVALDVEILAALLVGLGVLECTPVLAAWAHGEPWLPYLQSAAPALLFGIPLFFSTRTRDRRMRPRDGFLVVSAAWVMVSIFGALPYLMTGTLGATDALFEAASGFTTTGSTVMTRIEGAPAGLLFWRSLTQWLGGMGIIVLAVAVLPLLGIGGMQLFQAEVPGPVTGKLTPRIADTARRLWFVYVGLTLAAFLSYLLAGMSAFDAVCHAFTTLATGGFSTRDASIAAFESPLIEWLVVFFMLAAGTNFVLHYRLLTGRFGEVARDDELRFYLGLVAVATALACWILARHAAGDAPLRTAAFQVVSIVTTTGYASADFEAWPDFGVLLLFNLLVVGAMAGSTAGGIKSMRVLIGIRALSRMVSILPHRRGMRSLRYGGRAVADDVTNGIFVFFVAYLGLAGLAGLVVASAGYDVSTALSASLTAIGNVGPGIGEVGPFDNFAHFPGYVKLVLVFCMIAGRLEILTVLALFSPRFWRL
jgi:trk system potassium uptake protein TrkH